MLTEEGLALTQNQIYHVTVAHHIHFILKYILPSYKIFFEYYLKKFSHEAYMKLCIINHTLWLQNVLVNV